MVGDRKKNKASDIYLQPRDKFYQFLELHNSERKKTRRKERRGAYLMTILCVVIIIVSISTHENATYSLVNELFG